MVLGEALGWGEGLGYWRAVEGLVTGCVAAEAYYARHNYPGRDPDVRKKNRRTLGQPKMRLSNSDA